MPSRPTMAQEAMVAAVCAAVTEVVGPDRLTPEYDFFAMGLDSLTVAAVVAQLQRRLGLDVPLAAAFEHSTIGALALYLAKSTQRAADQVPPAAAPGEPFPAPAMTSLLARRLGASWQRSPAPVWAALDMPPGTVSAQALRAALDELTLRHEALRVSFERPAGGDGTVFATVGAAGTIPLDVVDAAGWTDQEVDRLILARRDRPVDRARGPLAAATLIRRGDLDILCLVLDHNICDPWSLRLLIAEIGRLCRGVALAEPGERDLTFSQWCALESRLIAQDRGQLAEFWCGLLPPPLDPAAGPPVPSAYPGALVTRRFQADAELRAGLLAQAATEGVSLLSLMGGHLLRAVRTVLGVDRVPVQVDSMNRDLLGTAGLVASTTSELWMAVDTSASSSPTAAAAAFQQSLLKAVSQQMTPPFLVRDALAERFGEDFRPWLFLAVNQWQPTLEFAGGSARLRPVPAGRDVGTPMSLNVTDRGSCLDFELRTWANFVEPQVTGQLARTLADSVADSAGDARRPQIEEETREH
ncbi:condensation domain-containing protein [Kitasatospora viridis]|nr:condensation domain-containing protein [Kitasatospora viridis]